MPGDDVKYRASSVHLFFQVNISKDAWDIPVWNLAPSPVPGVVLGWTLISVATRLDFILGFFRCRVKPRSYSEKRVLYLIWSPHSNSDWIEGVQILTSITNWTTLYLFLNARVLSDIVHSAYEQEDPEKWGRKSEYQIIFLFFQVWEREEEMPPVPSLPPTSNR